MGNALGSVVRVEDEPSPYPITLGGVDSRTIQSEAQSVAMGTASVYLVYRLGRVAYGRPAGLLAALFRAVVPLHVAHSHMAVTDVHTQVTHVEQQVCGTHVESFKFNGAWHSADRAFQ